MSDSTRPKPSAPLTRGRAKRVFKVGELATSVGSSYVWEALKSPFRSAGKRQQSLLDTHVRNELGKYPEQLFREFDEEAFAAASLGQVHRAVLKSGEEVVVKVQYPGVDET